MIDYMISSVTYLSYRRSSKPELWPSKLLLSVASLSPLNLPELQAILKARNIPVCGFYPASQDGPSANNEKVYMALFTMLQQRNAVRIYNEQKEYTPHLRFVGGVCSLSIPWTTCWTWDSPLSYSKRPGSEAFRSNFYE